jgi:uncharacterized membrane protein YhaH (DUF805 family)
MVSSVIEVAAMIELGVMPGTPEFNSYGPDPRGASPAGAAI